MKNRLFKGMLNAAILISTLVALSSLALCADYSGISISADYIQSNPRGNLDRLFDKTSTAGYSFEYMYNDYTGLVQSTSYYSWDREQKTVSAVVIPLIIDGKLAYPITSKFSVYAQAGLGLYITALDYEYRNDQSIRDTDSFDIGYNYGFGISYSIWDHFGASLKVLKHRVDIDALGDSTEWRDTILGLTYSF